MDMSHTIEPTVKRSFARSASVRVVLAAAILATASVVGPDLAGRSAGSRLLAAQSAGPAYTDWTVPVNLGPLVNSQYSENHPNISKDGLSLFFHSDRPDGQGGLDLWVSHRATLDAPWEAPQNLGATINSPYDDRVPYLALGERWLFFGSTRPLGFGGIDLWIAGRPDKRDDFGWESPTNLGGTINSAYDDDGASMFEDDHGRLVLYFTSNRPGGPGDFDIYQSVEQPDGSLGAPALVPGINSSGRDTRTAITRDGLELFVTSNRPGSQGLDLWTATRGTTDDHWSPLTEAPLAMVNSSSNDGAPAISFDRQTIFFYSNRPGGYGGNDLYMATRSRVHGNGGR
jgi:WD40-like Beta Propeller Repeat